MSRFPWANESRTSSSPSDCSPLAALAAVGALLLTLTQSHLKKYQAILTGVETMRVQQIADITDSSPSRVRREIQAHDRLRR